MGFDDIVNKGKQFFDENKEKVQGALNSDKAEEISDKVIQGVAGAAKKVVPAEHHAKVDGVAKKVDDAIGSNKGGDATPGPTNPTPPAPPAE